MSAIPQATRDQIIFPERISGDTFRIFRDIGARELVIIGGAVILTMLLLITSIDLIPKVIIGGLTVLTAVTAAKLRPRGYLPEKLLLNVVRALLSPRVYIHRTAYPKVETLTVPQTPAKPAEDIEDKRKAEEEKRRRRAEKPAQEKPQKQPKVTRFPRARARTIPLPQANILVFSGMVLVVAFMIVGYILIEQPTVAITLAQFIRR